jgi:thiol peroxidase
MADITLGGDPVKTIGELPRVGETAPDFKLTRSDLSDVTLKDMAGKKVVLNIFPSVDTPVCSASVRRFNTEIVKFPDAVVLSISLDLPFAHSRFCEAEGIKDVISLTELRNRDFGRDYGVRMIDGPLEGLLARAVVILDENGRVVYTQLVSDIKEEPDYDTVINVLKSMTAAANGDVCVSSSTAEHSRADSFDEPCDDGRAG